MWWIILLVTLSGGVLGWDQDQLDVFDVVEEVNQNFYELMNIKPDADNSQVRFHTTHPDISNRLLLL